MGSRKGGKPPGRPRQPKEKLEIRDVMHEWDQSDEVRDRMRNDGVLMHPKSSPSEDIPTCIKNATLLQPLLTRMGMMQTRSLPLIDELRGEVEGLFRKNKLGDQAENGSIVIESAWAIHKLLGFVKMKVRRVEVSTAPGFMFWRSVFDSLWLASLCATPLNLPFHCQNRVRHFKVRSP